MTFVRFKIIDFDVFQKVTHGYKRSKMNKRIFADRLYNEQSQIRQ
jgi:hypothetical protein